jgi:hypothetical protein
METYFLAKTTTYFLGRYPHLKVGVLGRSPGKSPGFFGDLTPQEKPQKSRPTDKKYPENRVFDTRKYGFLGIVCR